jgi:hypothetical protein
MAYMAAMSARDLETVSGALNVQVDGACGWLRGRYGEPGKIFYSLWFFVLMEGGAVCYN